MVDTMLGRLLNRKQKGMFTVEAVLILPVILLSVLAVVYISIIKFQDVVSVAEATRSANRVSAYWGFIGEDNPASLRLPSSDVSAEDLITKQMYESRSPYRLIASFFENRKRKENGKDYTNRRIAGIKYNPYSASGTDYAKFEFDSYFLASFTKVTITKKYINPLGTLLEMFGIGTQQTYTQHSTSVTTNPTEFIRNWDTIVQVGDYFLN